MVEVGYGIRRWVGVWETYDFYGTVPGAGAECVFADEIPVDGEDFALVLLPGLNGEVVDADVEELDGAIAGCDDELVFMGFGPGEIVEGVLGVEPENWVSRVGRQRWWGARVYHFSVTMPFGVSPRM